MRVGLRAPSIRAMCGAMCGAIMPTKLNGPKTSVALPVGVATNKRKTPRDHPRMDALRTRGVITERQHVDPAPEQGR